MKVKIFRIPQEGSTLELDINKWLTEHSNDIDIVKILQSECSTYNSVINTTITIFYEDVIN